MNYDKLISAATRVRERAYAPYSGFPVGAALEMEAGEIFTGCNVENLSYGLTLCAERAAAVAAIAAGQRKFQRIVILADTDEPISPCGACRQFLAEFNPQLEMVLCTLGGKQVVYSLEELLPRAATGILNRS